MPTIGSARCPAGRLSQGRVHLGQDGPKWRINGNGVSQDRRFSLPEDNIRHVYYRRSSNTRGVDGTSCGAGAWIPSSFENCPATGLQLRTDSGKLQIRSSPPYIKRLVAEPAPKTRTEPPVMRISSQATLKEQRPPFIALLVCAGFFLGETGCQSLKLLTCGRYRYVSGQVADNPGEYVKQSYWNPQQ